MNLKEYLFHKKIMVKDFAKMVDYSPVYVSQVMGRAIKPGAKFIKHVERLTGGQVTGQELLTGKNACNCACCRKNRFSDEAA